MNDAKLYKLNSAGEQRMAEAVKICQTFGYPKQAAKLVLETTGRVIQPHHSAGYMQVTVQFGARKGIHTRVFRSFNGYTWELFDSWRNNWPRSKNNM